MTRDEARERARLLLGDRLTQLAEQTGVASVVRKIEQVTGRRCGCAQRAAALNRWDAGRRR